MIRKIVIGIASTMGAGLIAWLSTIYTDTRADVLEVKVEANKTSITAIQNDVQDIHRIYYKKYRGK